MNNRVFILGVPVDALTKQEAQAKLHAMLSEPKSHHVMTPNNEMLVSAFHHKDFFEVLQKTDLNLPDSTGLLWAAKKTGQVLPERVTGVDTVTEFCSTLSAEHPVYLLGGGEGISERAAVALQNKNPHLTIVGMEGGEIHEGNPERIERINASGAQILFVAFGAPQQDLWIDQYLSKLPHIRIAMGVGGTFDFLAGTVKRAPLWMQNAGLEWLWRFLVHPKRFKRIWTAVVTFPLLVRRYGRSAPG